MPLICVAQKCVACCCMEFDKAVGFGKSVRIHFWSLIMRCSNETDYNCEPGALTRLVCVCVCVCVCVTFFDLLHFYHFFFISVEKGRVRWRKRWKRWRCLVIAHLIRSCPPIFSLALTFTFILRTLVTLSLFHSV